MSRSNGLKLLALILLTLSVNAVEARRIPHPVATVAIEGIDGIYDGGMIRVIGCGVKLPDYIDPNTCKYKRAKKTN